MSGTPIESRPARPRSAQRRASGRLGISAVRLLSALFLAIAPARADVGDLAPAIEASEWVGAPLDWQASKGRVVLILFVKARDKRSEAALRDVSEALARKKDGFLPVLVSDSPKGEVDAWARPLLKAPLRVAIEKDSRVSTAFLAQTTPFAVVVDRTTRIRFAGHPLDERLELAKVLADTVNEPERWLRDDTSPRLNAAWNAIGKKDWATAIRELVRVRDDKDADPADQARASTLFARVAKEGDRLLSAAQELERKGELADAVDAYDAVARDFAGADPGRVAKASAEAIAKDKDKKKELEACRAFRDARALENGGKKAEAIKAYRKIVSKWKGTKTADKAKARADELAKKK